MPTSDESYSKNWTADTLLIIIIICGSETAKRLENIMETQTCYIVHSIKLAAETYLANVPPYSHTMAYTRSTIASGVVLFVLSTACSEAFVPLSGVKGSVRVGGASSSSRTATCANARSGICMSTADDHDILLRVAKGEKADRAPVWLMRQVGVFG